MHPPPAPLEDVIDDGLMTIQRASFLRKAGVETIVDNDLFLNPVNRADLLKSAIENISRSDFNFVIIHLFVSVSDVDYIPVDYGNLVQYRFLQKAPIPCTRTFGRL